MSKVSFSLFMAAATTQWHYRKTEYRNTLLVGHKVRILNNKYKGVSVVVTHRRDMPGAAQQRWSKVIV